MSIQYMSNGAEQWCLLKEVAALGRCHLIEVSLQCKQMARCNKTLLHNNRHRLYIVIDKHLYLEILTIIKFGDLHKIRMYFNIGRN